MSFYNGILNHDDIHKSSQIAQRGLPGVGFKLDDDGNYDIDNKKLTNVKNGDSDNDVMTKKQIEDHVSNKTTYINDINPGQVVKDKAVIYSNSGSIHSNSLYLKDQYGQETIFHNEDQDNNQIRLYIPNLKNNDSFGGRLKSSIVVTSIAQTIEGKKVFHDIEVPSPTIDGHAINKAYLDNEISKISDSSDNSNYVKKSGDTMTGKLLVPNVLFPIQGDLRQSLSYESMREIFLSRRENRPMYTNLDMSNHTIDNVKNAINKDQSINKGQFDNELGLKADKSDLLQYLKTNGSYPMKGSLNMGGNRITGLTQVPFYNGEAVNKRYLDTKVDSKADKSDLDNYFKLDGTKAIAGNINMNNNRIYKLPNPQLADEPATLGYVSQLNNNLFNSYLDLKGVRKMEGNLQMDGHNITGITNFPKADDEVSNKKYVDDNIIKSNIKPSHIPKNVFKYLMDDVNEWSSEYNIKVENFIDLAESPHSWDKRVLSITPIKDGNNYRFRLGLQMFPMKTNESYSLIVELYNRDFKTWGRQQTYIEGTGIWLKNHNTTKFQHQYGSNGDLYYTRTLIKFKKTSSSGPVQIYFTIHYDDQGGDLNTYAKEFKNQVYILAYGAKGDMDHIDSEVYDAHQAFEIDKTKMKMLVDLDMNNKAITNIKFPINGRDAVSKEYIDNTFIKRTNTLFSYIIGTINADHYFTLSNFRLTLPNIHIVNIILFPSVKEAINFETITIKHGTPESVLKYRFQYSGRRNATTVVINKFFGFLRSISSEFENNIPFIIIHKTFN